MIVHLLFQEQNETQDMLIVGCEIFGIRRKEQETTKVQPDTLKLHEPLFVELV